MKKLLLLLSCIGICICACSSLNSNSKEVKILKRVENVSYQIDKDTSALTVIGYYEDYKHTTYNYVVVRQVYYDMKVSTLFFERENTNDILIIYSSSL